MACYHPIPALKLGIKENGKLKIKFLPHRIQYSYDDLKRIYGDMLILIPCGKCLGCSLSYSKQWATRIMLEAGKYEHNMFLTLTYDDLHLPRNLVKKDLSNFMKRLRNYIDQVSPGTKIKFFASGEYGDHSNRPHYHAIIFNYWFDDCKHFNNKYYVSDTLEKLWKKGHCMVGFVENASAAYVARYSVKKKLSGSSSDEFVLMSRRPGIASDMFDESIYETDKIYVDGKVNSVPRYFDKIAENQGIDLTDIKKIRVKNANSIKDTKKLLRMHYADEQFYKEESIHALDNFTQRVRGF